MKSTLKINKNSKKKKKQSLSFNAPEGADNGRRGVREPGQNKPYNQQSVVYVEEI